MLLKKMNQLLSQRRNSELLKTNDNEHMTIQNLWHTARAVFRRKYIMMEAFLEKKRKKKENLK